MGRQLRTRSEAVSSSHRALHVPWVIPATLVDIFAFAYPSRRFESPWTGIIVHATQSVVIIVVVLTLVLG